MKELLKIYWTFFKMGAVTFGGGYTMLPILRREIVQKHQWVDEETIMDYYALSQGLPGIISINVSTFIGYTHRKEIGGISAALGIVSPCLIIISTIAFFLSNFRENVYVQYALAGISVCVVALILDAVIGFWKKGVKDYIAVLLCLATIVLSVFTSISPVTIVIVSALIGIAIKTIEERGDAKK